MMKKLLLFHAKYQVIKEATKVLQKLAYIKQEWLKSDLLYLIQFLVELHWATVLNEHQETAVPYPENNDHSKLHLLPSLYECLVFVDECLREIRDKEADCFGFYEETIPPSETIPLVEMDLVLEYVAVLFAELWNRELSSYPMPCLNFRSLLPTDFSASQINVCVSDIIAPPSPSSTACLTVKLFWVKFFSEKPSVKWVDFIHSFCSFYSLPSNIYGKGANSDTFQTFYNCLVDDQNFLSPSFNINQPVIEYHRLLEFCRDNSDSRSNSFFACFQKRCDPGTYLYVSGTIREAEIDYQKPTILKSLIGMKLTHVSCGDQHVAVVTAGGSLYTWGKGSFGRLGHGCEVEYKEPTFVDAFKDQPVCYVSCGYAFTAAITTKDRQLYTWGAGPNGRLGHNEESNCLFPRLVMALQEERIKG
jgi:hypothetical protein